MAVSLIGGEQVGCSLRKNVYKGPVLFLKTNARKQNTNIKGKYIS